MTLIAMGFFGGLIGYAWGWASAHYTVADECTKLGAFYVGKRVFKCTEIETKQ